MAKRPPQRPKRLKLTEEQRKNLASRASYVGSGEHKSRRWWGGQPASRQLPGGKVGRPRKPVTTICPLESEEDRSRATEWVQSAILAGQYKFVEADKRFPKKIWFEADGKVWFGLCINSELGEYKGWPIDEEERRSIFG